jgi:hypothetical protein
LELIAWQPAVLPRLFGYLAILLAVVFESLGMIFLLTLTLPAEVTAVAGIQALWWLAAAITLLIKSKKLDGRGLAAVSR